jgi:quinol monooxygenase YgiN
VNHFAIVEVWQSKQAYDAHLAAPHSKAFRDALQMGLGSPFDERLYNALP